MCTSLSVANARKFDLLHLKSLRDVFETGAQLALATITLLSKSAMESVRDGSFDFGCNATVATAFQRTLRIYGAQ